MKLSQLLGKTFNFLGRALDSTEKVFDITDNVLDSAIAMTEDVKLDAQVDNKINQQARAKRMLDLGISE